MSDYTVTNNRVLFYLSPQLLPKTQRQVTVYRNYDVQIQQQKAQMLKYE